MNRVLEWLLGLEQIRLGRDAPVLFQWQGDLPPWLLFTLCLLLIFCVAYVYVRERTSVTRRLVLAMLRGAVLGLVIAVICRPALVHQRNRVDPAYVALAVDASRSMLVRDRFVDAELAASMVRGAVLTDPAMLTSRNRAELVTAALLRDDAAPVRRLLTANGVELVSFGGTVETVDLAAKGAETTSIAQGLSALAPTGLSTDIAGAIQHVISGTHGRRIAAIVLASDGQATSAGGMKDAIDLARDRQIPIYPIRLGSPVRARDVEVGPLRAEAAVFMNDVMVIEAAITVAGLSEPTPITAELVDERTDAVAATVTFDADPNDPVRKVELSTKPPAAGRMRYRVQVAPLPDEQITDNNADAVDVRIMDERIRVLYVDGHPRYEYRYIKNALLREKTVDLSVLLLDADDQFVQEGTDPIRRFPDTAEELNRYDVVLFGDVDPRGGWLSASQVTMLQDHVGNDGAGFGVIAGERAAPFRFLGTPLEKLLPVKLDAGFLGSYEGELAVGFSPVVTREGLQTRVFRPFAERGQPSESLSERNASDADNELLDALPALYWYARTLGPRAGASVLAQHPTARTAIGPMPLVVLGRYGAGRIFFQATDDTWRWRRHTGELFHDAYWVQVVRLLSRGDRSATSKRLAIRTDRKRYGYGAAAQVQVELIAPDLLENAKDHMTVNVSRTVGPNRTDAAALDRRSSEDALAESNGLRVERLSADSSLYEGTYVPPSPGSYVFAPADVLMPLGDDHPTAAIRVDPPDLESRNPQADFAALERMAEATGGKVIALDELENEFGAIRDRSVQIPDDTTEPLWDSKMVLGLFVLMISVEWILRKAYGLL